MYLTLPITGKKTVPIDPRHAMTRDGYTKRAGAPTDTMIQINGEKRWRRVMVWQFRNAGTCFVKIKGECLIIP